MVDSDESKDINIDDLPSAEKIAGVEFTEEERELLIKGVKNYIESYKKFRDIEIDNSVVPALGFDPRPVPPYFFSPDYPPVSTPIELEKPENEEEIAFLPITHLAHLLKTQKISSVELTNIYLNRLKKYNDKLEAVITLTEDLALTQAKQADDEITNGNYRGLLHGIPYGVKDLFAHPDFPTTWGAMPYKDQQREEKATVIQKLEEKGAVMIAKLSLGALAWGDVWFGGQTKSPFNLEEGSSGSSAGSASAVMAGLVGFSLGTETLGSIISPSTMCGATGLRPTFGRVSRYGAMALSWSMDKVGPICRTVEDCAIVFDAIYGPDGKDPSVISKPFRWDYHIDLNKLKVGYDAEAFDNIEDEVQKSNDNATLKKLEELGVELIPISFPDFPVQDLMLILQAEAAAAFDELTLSNKDDEMIRQVEQAWPNIFRQARLIPAVEYIKANRLRRLLVEEMDSLLQGIDVYIAPSYSKHIYITNFTGHPTTVVPNGVRENNISTTITFIGNLFNESASLQLAKFYQDNTEFHLRRPIID